MSTVAHLAKSPLPVCLVTGASSGIGLATATALAQRGVQIGLVCRTEGGGRAARDAIRRARPSAGPIDVWVADLASFSSVRGAAARICAHYERVDLLVNNAGAVFSSRTVSEDGLEMHFATNYAGHFLLTCLLMDRLLRAPRPQVVTMGSSLYRFGMLRLDDLAYERPYHLVPAYARSKLAVLLFTLELAERARGRWLRANCIDPGFVNTTIHRGARGHQRWLATRLERFGRQADDVGRRIARITERVDAENVSGEYMDLDGPRRLSDRTRDPVGRHALWKASCSWLRPSEARVLETLDSKCSRSHD